ncbi:NTP transferase domain-containing protein [Pirellula sp. SH-Sr6A]|uniref:NTP transferase domain-containing protein n=1 Tax=Pirellula sp. SH-Sr6A TaxID=1632865 RepID=UPI0021113328|nr:NTP transferase domain-containing protein [Pirellula sp. SH-Sr6A]
MQTTIVINAAGCGSRLGMGVPKSLVRVGKRRILDWQLNEMCAPTDRVKIVVGYMGHQVAKLAKNLFPSIEILTNPDWATTKTAASLSLGKAGVSGRVLSLDGDLLVHPEDFRRMVECQSDAIGVTPVISTQPVFAKLSDSGACESFSFQQPTPWEWTGLVNFNAQAVPDGKANVFEMMHCILPATTVCVRTVEVDTAEDLRQAPLIWSAMMKDILKKGFSNGLAENSRLLAG